VCLKTQQKGNNYTSQGYRTITSKKKGASLRGPLKKHNDTNHIGSRSEILNIHKILIQIIANSFYIKILSMYYEPCNSSF
jgi:hypothetical protein